WLRGAELGPCEPQRPDDRQRLPARVQVLAPSEGPRDRPRPRRAAGRDPAGQRASGPVRERSRRRRSRRRRHVRPRPCNPRPARSRRLMPRRPRIAGGVLAFALVAAGCSSTALPPSTSPSPSASAPPAGTAPPAGSIATQTDIVAAGATHIDVAGEPDWLAVAGGS